MRGAAARRSRPRREPRPPPGARRPTCPPPTSQFEVDLARRVFEQIGWPPAALEWKCIDWDEILEDLYAGGAECAVAVAGMLVTTRALERGVVFSWPALQSSLGILVRSAAATRGGSFAFVEAFTWQAGSAKL